MWFFIALAWIGLVVWIVWSYRRKQARLEAEREKQLAGIISEFKSGAVSAAPTAAPALAIPPVATVIPPVPERPPVADCRGKQPLLPQPHSLLYFILRTGLPDHEIFANLPLADVVELGSSLQGYDREQKMRSLAQLKVDFVVCTRKLEVVAAVVVSNAAAAPAGSEKPTLTEQWLKAAGLRLLKIDRAALPRHHQIREMVYGANAVAPVSAAPAAN